MIVFSVLLSLCFVGVLIGMLTDLCIYLKEVCKDGNEENQGTENRRIFHPQAGGISKGRCSMGTGKLRA